MSLGVAKIDLHWALPVLKAQVQGQVSNFQTKLQTRVILMSEHRHLELHNQRTCTSLAQPIRTKMCRGFYQSSVQRSVQIYILTACLGAGLIIPSTSPRKLKSTF